ncbi:MAG TPA: TRAM domain-containing protein [Candidatus Nanoarchaeia archaeon]|nr:TRAM domain-containing protein [Candidatus Nanoarchaeia archaeon]
MSPKKRAPRNAKNRGRKDLVYPVELGEEYEVDVTDLSPRGEGIAKVRGYSIFVMGPKVGEHVKVRITHLDPVCADAELVT